MAKKTKDITKAATVPAEDKELTAWKTRITQGESNLQSFYSKCASWYDLLHARVKDDDFAWHSRYFDPVLPAKIWNIVAKVVAGGSRWLVSAVGKGLSDPVVRLQSKAMEEALKFYEDNPELDEPMRIKYAVALLDAAVCGVGYMKVPWTIKKKAYYERLFDEAGNPQTDKAGDLVQKKKSFSLKFPDAINISVGDVMYSNVRQGSIQASPWIAIRSFQALDELKKMNQSNGGSYYENLETIQGKGATFDQLTMARNRLYQQEPDRSINVVEIHECYEKAFEDDGECVYVTVVANRQTIIKPRTKLNYWHGKYPIAEFKIKPRGFSPSGEGIMETNERGIWAINDATNHYMDAWNLANNPMVMQDEDSLVDSYEVAPGNSIIYKGTEPKPFMFPMPSVQSYEGIYNRLLQSLEANSISGYQTGATADSTDQTAGTLGGIKAIQSAGDDLLNFYRQVFREGVAQVGTMWMQLIQQFLDEEIWVEITNDDGTIPVQITPDVLQGNFRLDLDEQSLQSSDKNQEKSDFVEYVGQASAIAKQSIEEGQPLPIKWVEIFKDMTEIWGKDKDKYIDEQAQQQMMAGAEPPPPPMPGQDQNIMPQGQGEMPPEQGAVPPPPPPTSSEAETAQVPPPPPPIQ